VTRDEAGAVFEESGSGDAVDENVEEAGAEGEWGWGRGEAIAVFCSKSEK
jgi:hypothetical protein